MQNAQELYYLSNDLDPEYKYRSSIGEEYKKLQIPTLYCFGQYSENKQTINFLQENNLSYETFPNAFHWVMIDQKDNFYNYVHKWVQNNSRVVWEEGIRPKIVDPG